MKPVHLLICDGNWGRMREEALRLEGAGIPSLLLVKVKPSFELRELIRMIPARPLIRHRFIHRKIFRITLPLRVAWLLASQPVGRVVCDRERIFRIFSPWFRRLGIPCESL